MKLKAIVTGFKKLKIGVVGDVVADVNIYGMPTRISREAPVLIVRQASESMNPGGAGNAACNLAALGAEVYPVSLTGDDDLGDRLLDACAAGGLDTSRIFRSKNRWTITKTRILAGSPDTTKQQVIRIDREPDRSLSTTDKNRVSAAVGGLSGDVDAFLVSDYGYGVVTGAVVRALESFGGAVVADSRYGLKRYRRLSAITPNTAEAEAVSGVRIKSDAGASMAAKAIFRKTGAENIVITRGNAGMAVFDRTGRSEFLQVHGPKEITDVTGAGDTVAAAVTLSLAAGADIFAAAYIANIAAGIVVAKRGTRTASAEELRAAL